jgi:uncharacterized membrane protein YgcG
MPDREKVLRFLQDWYDCEYLGRINHGEIIEPEREKLLKQAIAMLKEQTHGETFTVIDTKTGKEADEYNIALHEDWAKGLCYCDMEGWAIENDGTLLLVDECGRFAYADRERFKVVWNV